PHGFWQRRQFHFAEILGLGVGWFSQRRRRGGEGGKQSVGQFCQIDHRGVIDLWLHVATILLIEDSKGFSRNGHSYGWQTLGVCALEAKMAKKIGVRELKNNASKIVRAVREEGAEYVVTLHGEPVAVLRPLAEEQEQQELDAEIA